MKGLRVLIFLMVMIPSIIVRAQIEEFSDSLLNQYTAKQDAIMNRPIEFDKLFPSYNIEEGAGLFGGHFNHVGNHFYKYKDTPHFYALKVSSQYDTISFSSIPKGKYEVVGMVSTKEEMEHEVSLLKGNAVWKDGEISLHRHRYHFEETENYTISQKSRPDILERYFDLLQSKVKYSVEDINRSIHNGKVIYNDPVYKIRDNNGCYYYLFDCYRYNFQQVNFCMFEPFREWLLYERYEYFSKILSENEWTIDDYEGKNIYIEDKNGLKYTFTTPIKVSCKHLSQKDGIYMAVLGIQDDSIAIAARVSYFMNERYFRNGNSVSDTMFIPTFSLYSSSYNQKLFSIISKNDMEQLRKMETDFNNRQYASSEKTKQRLAEQQELYKINQEKIERERREKEQNVISKYGEKFGGYVNRHEVCVGMTREMCILSWGYPRNITKHTRGAQEEEILCYGLNKYLIIRNGKLEEIVSQIQYF